MAQAQEERLAVSGAEVILLILLVMAGIGLWIWMEWAFTAFYSAPTEQQFLNTPSINLKQDELTRLEALRKDAASQLLAAELDQLKQRATKKSLETLHPGIDKVQQGASTSEAVKSYEAAQAQELAAGELINLLNARIKKASTDAERLTKELDPERQTATEEFKRAQTKYLLTKSAAVFVLPLAIILLPSLIVRGSVNRLASGRVWTSQGSILFFVVVCTLLILFAYQAFQLTGAVLVGMILFLFLLRMSKWTSRVSHGRESE
jgi:hypothetical protein